MKYFTFIALFSFGLNFAGQSSPVKRDSTKKSGKQSLSFTFGINDTYPTVIQFTDNYSTGVSPSSSTQLWGELKYNIAFKQTDHSSLGVNMGIGFISYKYTGTTYNLGDLLPGLPALQETDNIEIKTGFFVNEKIAKGISWYNEVGAYLSVQIYSFYPPNLLAGPNGIWNLPVNYYPLLDLTNEGTDIYLYYQAGITLKATKNLSVTPTAELPLFNITGRSYSWNQLINIDTMYYPSTNRVNAYNSLRAGIMLTYNFGN